MSNRTSRPIPHTPGLDGLTAPSGPLGPEDDPPDEELLALAAAVEVLRQ